MRNTKLASDNVIILYIPLPDGTIKAVNSQNLQTIWLSEIGGEIKEISKNGDALIVTAGLGSKENGDKGTYSIQSISCATGITQWKNEITTDDKTKSVFTLTNANSDKIYFLTEIGKVEILNKITGATIKSSNLGHSITSPTLTSDGKIYFGSAGNKIFAASEFESETKIDEIAELKSPVTTLMIDSNGNVYAGDKFGAVYSIQTGKQKTNWKGRTGAEITSIIEQSDKLLVSSSDNYIYLLSKKSGNKNWKKRLEGKITDVPLVFEGTAVLTPLGTNIATIVELKTGKTVNLIPVGNNADDSFSSSPVIIGKNIIFATVSGISTFSAESCQELKETR